MATLKTKVFASQSPQGLENAVNRWLEEMDTDADVEDIQFCTDDKYYCAMVVYDPMPELEDDEDEDNLSRTPQTPPPPPETDVDISDILKKNQKQFEAFAYNCFEQTGIDMQDLFCEIRTKTETGNLASHHTIIELRFFYPNRLNTKTLAFKARGSAHKFADAEKQFYTDLAQKATALIESGEYFSLLHKENELPKIHKHVSKFYHNINQN